MNELTILSALLIGFLGSGHCLGMCGGLAAATGQGSAGVTRLLSYNIGRIVTYGLIGALAGLLGEQLVKATPQLTLVLRGVAGLLLIAMGLYISQWWMGLTKLEQVGAVLWRYIQPLTRRLLPVNNHGQALLLGFLWGLLPCGLVYSTLSWALAAADWRQSALFMLAFGIGTLPAMVGVGMLNEALLKRLRQKNFRAVAGVLIIAMGIWTLLLPLQHRAHSHSGSMDTDSMQHQQGVITEHQH